MALSDLMCTHLVPLPCESRQHAHWKLSFGNPRRNGARIANHVEMPLYLPHLYVDPGVRQEIPAIHPTSICLQAASIRVSKGMPCWQQYIAFAYMCKW